MTHLHDMAPEELEAICRETRAIEFVKRDGTVLAAAPLTLRAEPDGSFTAPAFSFDVMETGTAARAHLLDGNGDPLTQLSISDSGHAEITIDSINFSMPTTITFSHFRVVPRRPE